ncbi:MAG: GNAT family N-acetyltransferase [Pseudomonadota bacterium]|nr:GNAT family N-acetyltransferase [Pseudomonadota bacterium]MEC8091107.1 GNAT family N-acetyltransferase [Pseudomonadota bacterium]MEC8261878.1 GNAT family N-acetyltransferase [Pseudomonadota bacterium]
MMTVPLEAGHLAAIAGIETAQLPNPLSLRNLQELASRPAFRGYVAVPEINADPAGYALVLAGGGSADLVSVAVMPTALRRGVATRLLLFALADLAAEGVEDVTLEVAVDNVPARALYDRLGFSEAGRRPGYYRRDRELVDAMVMHRRL